METTKQKQLLKRLDDFKIALLDYKPSIENQRYLNSVPLVLLVGPTASGRNTLIGLLVKTGRYHMIVSDTTRLPRVVNGKKEKNGEVYWFKTEDEVLNGIKEGNYIEAAIIHNQQVSGANISEVNTAQASGAIALKEIEVNGASTYRQYKPGILCIFLLPPTFDVWMERIRARGDVNEDELVRRLESAQKEISAALEVDYYEFVINHEIHKAANAVDQLANGQKAESSAHLTGREHAKELLISVQQFLSVA